MLYEFRGKIFFEEVKPSRVNGNCSDRIARSPPVDSALICKCYTLHFNRILPRLRVLGAVKLSKRTDDNEGTAPEKRDMVVRVAEVSALKTFVTVL